MDTLRIPCASCGNSLHVSAAVQGKLVRCPLCSTTFVVPLPTTPVSPVPSSPVQAPVTQHEREDRATPPASPLRKDFHPVRFKARVVKDDKRRFKGQLDATWAPEGLELRQGKWTLLSVPVGTRADYLNGARLAVNLEESRLELAVGGHATYQQRLARDVADYLNGKRSEPDLRGYAIPWYLFVPALLPIGIPILTLGGALPVALGVGLCAGCLALARVEKLPAIVRILLSLLLSGTGYAIVLAILIGGALFRRADRSTRPAAAPSTRTHRPIARVNRPTPSPQLPPARPEPPRHLPGKRQVIDVGEPILHMELSADGKTLATVSERHILKVWDADTGKERFCYVPPVPNKFPGLLLLSPDSRWVTAWAGHGPIEVRDMTGRVEARLDVGKELDPVTYSDFSFGAFSPDSKMLALTYGERVRFWQIPEGTEPAPLAHMIHTPGAVYTAVQFTPDGKTLVTAAARHRDQLGEVWDLTTARQKAVLERANKIGYPHMRLSPDGRLALVHTDRCASVFDWAADRSVLLWAPHFELTQVMFAADSRHLLSINRIGEIERWQIDTGKRLARFPSQPGLVGRNRLAITRDGKTVVTAVRGKVTFWDADKAFAPASP